MSPQYRHTSSSPPRARPFMMAYAIKGLQPILDFNADEWRRRLAEVALTPEQLQDGDGQIPLEQGFLAFEAASRWSHNPSLALDYASAFAIGQSGPLGFAIVNARSVRDALKAIVRYLPLVASHHDSRYEEDEVAGNVIWRYPGVRRAPRTQFITWGAALVVHRLKPAMPANWKPLAFDVETPAPQARSAFDAFFGPGLRFDQAQNRFAVERKLLDRSMPSANPRIFDLMTRLAELEQQRLGVHNSEFETEARRAIGQLLLDGRTSVADLAGQMGLVPAQLRRRFKEHDLDYRTLLDDVRKEAAHNYLRDPTLSITEIAFALGYSDSSIFTRACHKWFGMPPRDVRAKSATA